MIQQQRIQFLNSKPVKEKGVVIYWMQASQRARYNHALEYGIRQANIMNVPLVVYFGITDNYPSANYRHYLFMLEGLKEIQKELKEQDIQMIILHCSPEKGILELSKHARLVITDCGYTKIQRQWRREAAENLDCLLVQVESDVVIPVTDTSLKEEYAARTIRSKIHKKLPFYLVPLESQIVKQSSLNIDFDIETLDITDIKGTLSQLNIDRSIPAAAFSGGPSQGELLLDEFIEKKLSRYDKDRNDPNIDGLSNMSPYLHFGQVSPLCIALKVKEAGGGGVDAYLEELIVRRELSMNFVYYNGNYDNFAGLPDWCKKTINEHRFDEREYIYNIKELEKAKSHDPYWNAAQREMVLTGKMHGYMRMYWGKKIMEWMENPEEAYRTALYLNNKYELDGRDPNGWTGVAWCFGKHDRPWKERKIFGKIRYMNARGLKRKFDADAYVKRYNSGHLKESR